MNFDLEGVTLQCMHVLLWGREFPELPGSCAVPLDVDLSNEAANHGHWGYLQNHCSCSQILLWYYSPFDETPSGLGLHLAFKRAKKSPALLLSRDSGLEQCELCPQGKHKYMKLPNTTAKSKSIRYRHFTACKNKLFDEDFGCWNDSLGYRYSILQNWPHAMSFVPSHKYCEKGQTMIDQNTRFKVSRNSIGLSRHPL